jgi:hypothetical protein
MMVRRCDDVFSDGNKLIWSLQSITITVIRIGHCKEVYR